MSTRRKEPLQHHVQVNCFSCGQKTAEFVLHLEWDCLQFQLCLCPDCADLENEYLIRELIVDEPGHRHAMGA